MTNEKRKTAAACIILIVMAIILGVNGFLHQRELDRETGWVNGYSTGYSIGYTDYLNGLQQISSKLAAQIVPYETGTGKWKYFMMGFIDGYDDAQTGENLWYTDES